MAVSATRAGGFTELAKPNRLVTTGPYALSRNPMYASWTLVYVGCALVIGTSWPLMLLPSVAVVVHKEAFAEELRLEDRFGDVCMTYARRVHRYL